MTSRSLPQLKLWQRALATTHGEAQAADLARRIQARYDDLYAHRRRYDRWALRTHLEGTILPGLAAYQALRADGLDAQAALEEVKRLLEATYHAAQRRQIVWMKNLPFFFRLFRFITRSMLRVSFPPEGWDFEWVEDSPDCLAFDTHRCFYLDTLTAYGSPELTPAFCYTDDIMMADFSDRISWERTTTLGRGGDRCDFRYRRIR